MGSPVMWFEVTSTDPERSREFSTSLFDWSAQAPPELGGYTLLDTGAPAETVRGGIGAADPVPADNGSIAVLADPDGHAVGLWA